MMNKPMTTEGLFHRIENILKEKGKMPDILDYSLATNKSVPIKTYEFDLGAALLMGATKGFI